MNLNPDFLTPGGLTIPVSKCNAERVAPYLIKSLESKEAQPGNFLSYINSPILLTIKKL
jgi:hypothetical protein